jgi:hypothetical protein
MGRHTPWSQTLPAVHGSAQLPQFASSLSRLTQLVPHSCSPTAQLSGGIVLIAATTLPSVARQAPTAQVAPAGQDNPQPPQLAASSIGSTQPLAHAS